MAAVPFAWSGHDDEGNVVSGSGSVQMNAVTQLTEYRDFAVQNYAGMYSATKGLVGAGVAASVFQIAPGSSTKASIAAPAGGTCPLFVQDFGGHSASTSAAGLDIGGYELRGTEQGHIYNGMRVGYSTAAKIHDLLITGIPGTSSSPPGETFSLDVWRTTDATLSRVVLDGRRGGAGVAQAGTLLGYNYNAGTTTCDDVAANYTTAGFAVAMWQCTGAQVFNRCDFRHCRKAVNIEQAIGGSYVFNACDFRDTTGAPFVAQISSITTSAKVQFNDPIVDAYPLQVRTYPGAGVQKDSDITMTIAGKDVTADPTKFLIVHAG